MQIKNATEVYDLYWQFACKRQDIFFKRYNHVSPPWTDDAVLLKYRFTNAYRAIDRVSQYLIQNVIYSKAQVYSEEDILFRILLFKFFNKIETWEMLEGELGDLTYSNFDIDQYNQVLHNAIYQKSKIYSAAYIMPSGKKEFGSDFKHENNLALLDMMMRDNLLQKVGQAKSLKDLYICLLDYPTIGPFLAFQYAIDINYSELCDFSEMSFVVAGPGAINGIQKCFPCVNKDYEYIIRFVAEHQEEEFAKRGLNFQTLFGRPLQLIDCQNLFCETDKYARMKCPEIKSKANRVRIKQTFTPKIGDITLFLPPKWGLNY